MDAAELRMIPASLADGCSGRTMSMAVMGILRSYAILHYDVGNFVSVLVAVVKSGFQQLHVLK